MCHYSSVLIKDTLQKKQLLLSYPGHRIWSRRSARGHQSWAGTKARSSSLARCRSSEIRRHALNTGRWWSRIYPPWESRAGIRDATGAAAPLAWLCPALRPQPSTSPSLRPTSPPRALGPGDALHLLMLPRHPPVSPGQDLTLHDLTEHFEAFLQFAGAHAAGEVSDVHHPAFSLRSKRKVSGLGTLLPTPRRALGAQGTEEPRHASTGGQAAAWPHRRGHRLTSPGSGCLRASQLMAVTPRTPLLQGKAATSPFFSFKFLLHSCSFFSFPR